ncbi:MAG: hypothetical protein NTZ09_02900 [Candidatus Hydrogenedentes bacterium]|nr:hypothetical protein [Candidatus Hydrogenedentota bacterium]
MYHGEDADGNPLDPEQIYAQLGYRYLPEDVDRYLAGNMRPDEQEVFPLNAFLAGMRIEGVNQSGVSFDLGGAPRPLIMPLDPRLQAMQLAVNIADSADDDYARTELSTNDLQQLEYDPWWYALQIENGVPPEEAKRPINYTVAGTEAIRINEIMVRPVRRVEAEIDWFYGQANQPYYFPDTAVGGSPFRIQCYRLCDERRTIPGTVPTVEYQANLDSINMEGVWTLNALTPNFPVGVIGNSAVLATKVKNINVDIYDGVDTDPNLPPTPLLNVIEYRFQPYKYLPPGRYYLTINTKDAAGNYVLDKNTAQTNFKFVVKYVGDAAAAATYCVNPNADPALQSSITVDNSGRRILDDLVLGTLPGAAYVPAFDGPVCGYENQRDDTTTPSGFLFCSGERPSNAANTDLGYWRDNQAHTVTIPRYAPAGEQVYLHIAVYYNGEPSSLPGGLFTINFFDFSQEPDHEWVEIENVSGQPVDLSGWQLTVGAPDPEGNVSSGDKVEMEVPYGTVIDSMPPYNRLLLAVSAFSPPIPEDPDPLTDTTFADAYKDNPFFWNGIGQVGTPGYRIYPFPDDPTTFFDAGDTTVPLIPVREEGVGGDGRGVPTGVSPFEASDAPKRIVQLGVLGLNAGLIPSDTTDDKAFIAKWVLRGGVFPNYPEHDSIDNDYDDHLIGLNNPPGIQGRDGIDHNGDSDATGPGEGVDEGRLWIDSPLQVHAGAGSFNILPFALLYDLMPSLYPGDLFLNPEWKEFIERRFSPGDNVFVSLYQGAHQQKRVVDRITYTERDVINRCIDDEVSTVDGNGVAFRPSLHDQSGAFTEAYKKFWPDNSMGIDFYRSLERKYHPLYNGDRFGTQNRWQATDGNYDDWSHEPVAVGSPKWNGSPLERNDAAWNVLDPSVDTQRLLRELTLVDIRNKSFDSLGDLMSLEYCTLNKAYSEYGNVPLSINALAGFQPEPETAGNIQSLMEAGVSDAIYLSPGAGAFRSLLPTAPTAAQLACSFVDPCGNTEYELPQAWRPFFLHEISFGTDTEPVPAGLPLDGNYWLLNGPTERPAGLEDPAVLRSRWPVEKRAVLFASRNLDSNGNATLYVEWDASSGLQDGTYDLYADTGLKLLDVSPDTLTDTGKFIRCRVMENVTERPAVNITVYTDTNGDGAITTTKQDANSKDSLGRLTTFRPDSRGYIYCGSISVNNNRLAVEIENAVQPPAPGVTADTLNTFAGVILTPRARTQGRININTVETRLYKDSDNVTRRLNVLAGIPGVFQDYPEQAVYERDYNFAVTVNVEATPEAYEFGMIIRCTGDSYYLLRVEKVPGGDPVATLYPVIDSVVMPQLNTASFPASEEYRLSLSITTDTTYDLFSIGCFLNNTVLFGAEDPILNNPLQTGTVGLISAMQSVGFANPAFSPVPGATFNRGWSGLGWTIDGDGLYRYDGANPTVPLASTSTLFTGYPPDDLLYSSDDEVRKLTTAPDANDPNDIRRTFVRAEWLASGRAFVKRAEHWDGRYFESISDLLVPYSNPDLNDPRDDNLTFWPLVIGRDFGGSVPDYLATQAMQESAWRLSRSANLMTTRSDIFEILVTVQAGTGEDLDGDGVINYRSDDEFTRTSERKTRTVYERP